MYKIRIITLLFILDLLLYSNLFCASSIVRNIKIEGLHKLNANELMSYIPFSIIIGQGLNKTDLVIDTNKIYLTGFFKKVEPKIITSNTGLDIIFVVEENSIISNVSFKNATIFSQNALLGQIKSKKNTVLNMEILQNDKQNLENYYSKEGYDFFKILSVDINASQNLLFTFDEGEIGDVNFIGLENVAGFILQRELAQTKGSIYNSQKIRRDRVNLLKLGYFSDISAPELQLDKLGKVKVTYKVKEKKANIINLGLETDKDNILGFVQANINHIGIPSSLLSTKAQFYREANEIKIKSYAISYYQSWFLNRWPLALSLDAWTKFNRRELFSDGSRYENERIGGNIILSYPILSNLLKLSEIIKVEEVKPINAGNFDNYKILSLSSILDFSSLDNVTRPKNGTYWSIEYEQSGNFGLNTKFLEYNRYSFNWATFWPVNLADTIGIHFFAGFFKPYDKSIKTFEFEGFSIGGSSSLRGYSEASDIFGATRKIRKLLFNCEYRHDINSDLEAIFFVDIGKLFDEEEIKLVESKYGYGAGLRWFTPLGPIRTDVAVNISKQILIHFNLGQVF